MYDKRMAKTISRARKRTPGRALSDTDWETIKKHAKQMAEELPNAQLLAYHKRRRRSIWSGLSSLYVIRGAL